MTPRREEGCATQRGDKIDGRRTAKLTLELGFRGGKMDQCWMKMAPHHVRDASVSGAGACNTNGSSCYLTLGHISFADKKSIND